MIKMKMKMMFANFFTAVRTDIMEQSGGKILTQTGLNVQFSYFISTIDLIDVISVNVQMEKQTGRGSAEGDQEKLQSCPFPWWLLLSAFLWLFVSPGLEEILSRKSLRTDNANDSSHVRYHMLMWRHA